jgi:hypothetical protein
MNSRICRAIACFGIVGLAAGAGLAAGSQDPLVVLRAAVAKGDVTYKLTEPEELIALVGKPRERRERADGGMIILEMAYPGFSAVFGRFKGQDSPFTLLDISAAGEALDIGRDRPVVLRNNADLRKMDRFSGLEGVSLARLDLRAERAILDAMSFDTRTLWPPGGKLPDGFDPAALIRKHQAPGLGVRELHSRGIDGRGVGVAIIDQPLLLGHQEYTSRIVRYDATGLEGMPPQMHGSPVASILVGQTLGVAPRAALTYFAVPMWKPDNIPYVEALRKILGWNRTLPAGERIRVVSISTGTFSRNPHFAEWGAALAEARNAGVLVVSCERSALRFGILSCRPGRDPDDRNSYVPSFYTLPDDVLRVPGAGRTLASFRGDAVYMLDRDGGVSWGAPYISGLAALAFEVDPDLAPERATQLLVETVQRTDAGPIVDPARFIAAVEKEKRRGQGA